MVRQNVDILPVGPQRPAYLIVVDEGGEVFGEGASRIAARAARALRELQRIGRAMCVNVLFSVQRGTATYVPSDMKKNVALKIVGQVDDDAEIAYLLDWNKSVRAADLTEQGGYFLRRDGSVPAMFKGFRLMPRQITDIARTTAYLRPNFDDAAKTVGGRLLAERWERLSPWLQRLAGDDVDEEDLNEANSGVTVDDGASGLAAGVSAAQTYAHEVKARMRAMSQRSAAEAKRQQVLSMPRHQVDAALAALTAMEPHDPRQPAVPAQQTGSEQPEPPPGSAASRLAFVVQLVEHAGEAGIKTEDVIEKVIAAGFTRRRQTVHETIAAAREAALIAPKPGEYAMWVVTRYAT
jgi:hypothetical protein